MISFADLVARQAREATIARRASAVRPVLSAASPPRPSRARARKAANFDHLAGLDAGMSRPAEMPAAASPGIQRGWTRAFAVALGNGRAPAPRANSAIQRGWDRAFANINRETR